MLVVPEAVVEAEVVAAVEAEGAVGVEVVGAVGAVAAEAPQAVDIATQVAAGAAALPPLGRSRFLELVAIVMARIADTDMEPLCDEQSTGRYTVCTTAHLIDTTTVRTTTT